MVMAMVKHDDDDDGGEDDVGDDGGDCDKQLLTW